MKRILVAYATKRGATARIAERIGETLRKSGFSADVLPAGRAQDLSGYDAVVLGSAVYMGLWRRDAVRFLKKNRERLAGLPVWVFISGPTGQGDPNALVEGQYFPKSLKEVIDGVKPRDITCFGGRLEMAELGPFERWIIGNVKAEAGDFRDWDRIEAWAGAIRL